MYTREDIIRIVEEEDVEFIRLQFTDLSGLTKNIAITSSQLERALDNGCSFNGAVIDGYGQIEEADMYLHPDLDTFVIFPWRPQQGKVARFLCDVYKANGEIFEGDSRMVLKRVVQQAEEKGIYLNVGPEFEFFLFPTDDDGSVTIDTGEQAGYFDVAPIDGGENVRRDIVLNLEEMGIEVESSFHEYAPCQHEIDLKYTDACAAADMIQSFRMTTKVIAKRHGLHATFMPKPRDGKEGSGMHLNFSLTDAEGKNILCDPDGENGLSEMAYQFIAGILKHLPAICLIVNPLVNSYKRLRPGFDAPVYAAWSATNRTASLRIPATRGEHTRIELRNPDAVSNGYLSIALCLAAGLEGIANKWMPPASVDFNLFHITEEEKAELGLVDLPGSLGAAIQAFEKDSFVQSVLGAHLSKRLVESKKLEWKQYLDHVSDWEINEYIRKF